MSKKGAEMLLEVMGDGKGGVKGMKRGRWEGVRVGRGVAYGD